MNDYYKKVTGKFELALLLLLYGFSLSHGANILAMFPLPLFSHTNGIMPVIRELAIRGHNVTLYSPYTEASTIGNLTEVKVNCDIGDILDEAVNGMLISSNKYKHYWIRWNFGIHTVDRCLQNQAVQDLIHDKYSKFDLIITESLYLQEPFAAFGYKFNAPVITYLPVALTPWASYVTGNISPFSYVPCLDLEASDHMDLFQRLENTLLNLIELAGALYYYLPKQDAIMRKHFNFLQFTLAERLAEPGFQLNQLPCLLDLLRRSPLTLTNSHYSVSYQRPYHSNVVEIGGVSMNMAKQLPQNLKTFMDNATNGVIYVSFGSFCPTVNLDRNIRDALITALSNVKQQVLLKWENDTFTEKPENIKVSSWFPQPSILAHPNCVLFITHGGLQSLTEAVFYGVPLVGIPLKGDQEYNVKAAVSYGMAEKINKLNMTSDAILGTINTVLGSIWYKENARKRSKILHDRPLNVLDNAIFWIEYVIRHNGAKHLRPATIDLTWYQYFLVDVLLIIFLPTIILLLIIYYLFRFFFENKKVRRQIKKKKE
ncbi:UDP-glycosyltransferase UGT4-like isoform X1 [Rhodnius prolixus]|uniref:UDP-glycosyltransferase UGT4-like isoform X1 n=1 Tax=Rhodnius prolixus TaxID=13249 RepID=UPI003D18A31D